jgi:hypothetical protein
MPLIDGDGKIHENVAGTASFFQSFLPPVGSSEHCEAVICPPFLNNTTAIHATRGTSIQIGAQNLYRVNDGVLTGEVSGRRRCSAPNPRPDVSGRQLRTRFASFNGFLVYRTPCGGAGLDLVGSAALVNP